MNKFILAFCREFGERAKRTRNKKGFTLSSTVITILLVMACIILFAGYGLIKQAFDSKAAAGFTSGLNEISQAILSTNSDAKLSYSLKLDNLTPPYHGKYSAPPLSAYDNITTLNIQDDVNGTRVITYDSQSQATYSGLDSGTMSVTPEFGDSQVGIPILMPGITFGGSDGFAPVVNLSIPRIEEDMVMGLFKAEPTTLGRQLIKNKMVTATVGSLTVTPKQLLEMYIGTGNTYDYVNAAGALPTRWAQFRIIDSANAAEFLSIHNDYINPEKYRLYSVSSVVSRAQALQAAEAVLGANLADAETVAALDELFTSFTDNIKEGQIIAVPTNKSNVVKSESSSYTRTKFTTTD